MVQIYIYGLKKIIIETFYGTVTSKKIVLLGFAFKSNTNDTRESPAISIALDLLENGANLVIHDPQVSESNISYALNENYSKIDKRYYEGNWQHTKNLDYAFNNADAVIILTEWEEYLKIGWNKIASKMRNPCWLFDTRGIVNDKEIHKTNLNFWKIGKGFIKRV